MQAPQSAMTVAKADPGPWDKVAKVRAHARAVGNTDSRSEDAVTATLRRSGGTLKHPRAQGCVAGNLPHLRCAREPQCWISAGKETHFERAPSLLPLGMRLGVQAGLSQRAALNLTTLTRAQDPQDPLA